MEIRYLGTSAAEGCPALFCKCNFCESLRHSNQIESFRTRSQVLINHDLLVDFPPDTYLHFLRDISLDLSSVRHVLITHSHEDHFYPEDILTHCDCFSGTVHETLHLYGNETVYNRFLNCLDAAPAAYHAKQYLCPHLLKPFVTVSVGGYKITPVLADHDPAELCYLYIIEQSGKTILYGNDTGIQICNKTWEYLGKFHYDLVSMDCTACTTSVTRGHMGIPNNLQFAERLKKLGCITSATRFILTHFSHHYALPQEQLEDLAALHGWMVAYDGKCVRI